MRGGGWSGPLTLMGSFTNYPLSDGTHSWTTSGRYISRRRPDPRDLLPGPSREELLDRAVKNVVKRIGWDDRTGVQAWSYIAPYPQTVARIQQEFLALLTYEDGIV